MINRTPPAFRSDPGGGFVKANGIYIGIIKNNTDPQRMGRLSVWIPDFGGDPENSNTWMTVSYASPFAGATNPASLRPNATDESGSQKSYGLWMIPPDLENQVLCCFANGDTSKGFWFACLWQQFMNHMIPAIAIGKTTDKEESYAPVVEYNKRGTGSLDNPGRPSFTPLTSGIKTQGLETDPERGASSTSARREAPSSVLGLLSPRGNSIHIDDDPDSDLIRMRTRGGVQVLLHNATGYVYINSKKGDSWLEISDSGINAYSAKDISIRSNGNLNFHADKNIVFDAGSGINFRSGGDLTFDSTGQVLTKAGGNILESAGGNISSTATGTYTRSGSYLYDNNGKPGPTITVPTAKNRADGQSSTKTLANVLPSHEPWSGHPHSGVPTETGSGQDISSRVGQPDGQTVHGNHGRSRRTGSGGNYSQKYTDNSPLKVVGKYQISEKVLASIKEASDISGMDAGYLTAMAQLESSFDPNADATTSSAGGLYQFTDGTWEQMTNQYGAQYNIGINDKYDPRSNAIMGALYARDNRDYLNSQGLDGTSSTNLYMAHFLGPAGASKFLSAADRDSNAPATSVVSSAQANANRTIFYNSDGSSKTIAQVRDNFAKKIEPNSQVYASYFTDNVV